MSESTAEKDRHCRSKLFGLLGQHRMLAGGFVGASFMAAMTEGIGVSLAVPLLESVQQGEGGLSNIPVLSLFNEQLENYSLVTRIRIVAIALIVLALVRGTFAFASTFIGHVLSISINIDMRRDVFQHIIDLDMQQIQKTRTGMLQAHLSSFTAQSGGLVQMVCSIGGQCCVFLVYLALMFLISVQMSVMVIVLLGMLIVLMRWKFHPTIRRINERLNQVQINLNNIGLESISGIQLIRLFVRERFTINRLDDAQAEYRQEAYRNSAMLAFIVPFLLTLTALMVAVLLLASTVVFQTDDPSWLGVLVLFLLIMFRLAMPAIALNQLAGQVAQSWPAFCKVIEFLESHHSKPQSAGGAEVEKINESIRVNELSFTYDSADDPALNGVSFEVPVGRMIALVGPSGAGKTTLINLFTRMFEPSGGGIAIDGRDLTEIDPKSWRKIVGVVPQETFLFNDTIEQNLRFAKDGVTHEQIEEAAKQACAHDFIMRQPNGYDTQLGERGAMLSGGQRQRIAIARAMLAKPQLLILDEATSHLDSEAEHAIQHAIQNLRQQCTMIVIAHRLSTVQQADQIVVLNEGRVAETGTHDELLELKGIYWQMVMTQQFVSDDE